MVLFSCTDGPLKVRSSSLQKTSLAEIVNDAERDGSVLALPFSIRVVKHAFRNNDMDVAFDDALDVLRCRDFLGVSVPEHCDALLNRVYGVTMEIVRAGGINLFHFDQAAMFMRILEERDARLVPVPRLYLEQVFWAGVQAGLDLQPAVAQWLGRDTYDDLVGMARGLRDIYVR